MFRQIVEKTAESSYSNTPHLHEECDVGYAGAKATRMLFFLIHQCITSPPGGGELQDSFQAVVNASS